MPGTDLKAFFARGPHKTPGVVYHGESQETKASGGAKNKQKHKTKRQLV